MDAITLLIDDHRRVQKLLEGYPTLSDLTAKVQAFTQISEALGVHAANEELHFYPAYQQATQDKAFVRNNFAEHQVVKDCLKKFRPDLTEGELDILIQTLGQALQEHIEEEETEMFPRARDAMGKDLLEVVGTKMKKAKPNLTQQVSFTVTMLADAAIKTHQEAGR